MAEYDFSTLNSSDFEELVCDLLNLDQPEGSLIKYKTFKDGKDKGIDLLYSSDKFEFEQVGQVKHYYRTGYDGLYQVLKSTEVKNVNALNPSRYIVATSVDLNENNTESIKNLFNPYIKNLNDVYGKKDLNRLIENHEEILNTHYKLWLSDFSILKKLLGSDLEFRSAHFVENELKRRLRLYVKTNVFEKARQTLKAKKILIIIGNPGVGKTTLAEMLVYEYIAEGYNLTYIFDDIKEAEKVLQPDDSKQIIYFDDFLGSNKVEINRARGRETALRSILRRVEKMENKLIIFTTRTSLLTTAIEESEKLKSFNIKARSNSVTLSEYDETLKKQLLQNHIEESDLNAELKDVLNENNIQSFIANHSSYTPRSVEFITTKELVNHMTKEQFKNFIHSSFDYPHEIWKHAYSEQITEDERLLLNTLISFGDSASIDELENAFISRIQYEVETNNKSKEMHAFKKALNKLDGGFITIKNDYEVRFINPSLIDFLVKYLKGDKDEVHRIANSVKYTSQLTERLFLLANSSVVKMPIHLQKRLITNYESFINNETRDYNLIQLALIIYNFVQDPKKEEIIFDIIDSISDWESLSSDYTLNTYFLKFMNSVKDNHYLYSLIQDRTEEIVNELFSGENELDRAITLLEDLTKNFELNFLEYNATNVINHLDQLFADEIFNTVDDLSDWITDEIEVYEKRSEFEALEKRINNLGLNYVVDLTEFDIDWYEIASHNDFRRMMEKDD
jgi:broad-specificity NMP kinase